MADSSPGSRIQRGSHVTLHYRIAVTVDGAEREVMSTFDAQPATLTIGCGVMAAPLEACLLGLEEGSSERFELAAGAGFGARNPELVQTLSMGAFEVNSDPSVDYRPGDIVRFSSPEGLQFSGVLKQRDAEKVVMDFNHPLAGMPVSFAVRIVGVL
jgi:FKBP-type peptidyl-prolyl cis-trans isomerase SlpA